MAVSHAVRMLTKDARRFATVRWVKNGFKTPASAGTPRNLLGLVLSDGLRLVGIGVALGLTTAFVLARFLESQLFGVTAHDPGTFIVVPVLLIAAAVLGCLIPARRATRIDPMMALRTQ